MQKRASPLNFHAFLKAKFPLLFQSKNKIPPCACRLSRDDGLVLPKVPVGYTAPPDYRSKSPMRFHAVFSGCRSNLRKTQCNRLTTLPDGADNAETVVSTICLVNTITMIISI